MRITLPAIRPALTYGIVLTAARALGEYGAVAVVSGAIQGQTETLTLIVQRDWNNFDQTGAYATVAVAGRDGRDRPDRPQPREAGA